MYVSWQTAAGCSHFQEPCRDAAQKCYTNGQTVVCQDVVTKHIFFYRSVLFVQFVQTHFLGSDMGLEASQNIVRKRQEKILDRFPVYCYTTREIH